MEPSGMKYQFRANVYHHSSSPDMSGWIFVSLPKELSVEIREIFKWRESGWGRMKITAKVGISQWQTAIWFDTRQDTYLLPLKAAVRKKENIESGQDVDITVWID